MLEDPTITPSPSGSARTAAQVTLRWHLQRGDVIFPKSTTPSRIQENFELFDFELTDDDMTAITALDKGDEGRIGGHPDTHGLRAQLSRAMCPELVEGHDRCALRHARRAGCTLNRLSALDRLAGRARSGG